MKLTKEHKLIIRLVVDGATNEQIGAEIGYSASTIKNRLKEIYSILNISGRFALVKKTLCEEETA